MRKGHPAIQNRFGRPGAEFVGPHQGRQSLGDAVQGMGPFGLFLGLQGFPVGHHFPGAADPGAAKHMGMPVDQFLHHIVDHILHGKESLFFCQPGVEHHLEEHIPHFFPHAGHIAVIDGFQHFIDFFHQFPAHGLVGLDPVPGTAARFPEYPDQFHQGPQVQDPRLVDAFSWSVFMVFPSFLLFQIPEFQFSGGQQAQSVHQGPGADFHRQTEYRSGQQPGGSRSPGPQDQSHHRR